MRKIRRTLAMLLCLLAAVPAYAASFETVPDVLRPGKQYEIVISADAVGLATLTLSGAEAYTLFAEYPLVSGENHILWDGMASGEVIVPPGEYTLRLQIAGGEAIEAPLRVGAPYPMITGISQNEYILEDEPLEITYTASEPGTLEVALYAYADGSRRTLGEHAAAQGENRLSWSGEAEGTRAAPGEYALVLTLKTANGMESMAHFCVIEVAENAPEGEEIVLVEATPTPVPTPAPPPVSAPYSQIDDGTFWSMTPGEPDDAVIWEILTQPITVYDGGLDTKPKTHAWAMENPDGTGAQVIQIHPQSQSLHVIGEVNEHGYVLVEAFSNYDEDYNPKTDAERAEAFDLKRGYVLAKHLKTVEVSQTHGILIDKLTQRLYLYIDGVRVTEMLIATGKIADGKYYNETIPGEYITISRTGGFASGNMYCDMAIRINGGILLHEVPYKPNADGTKNYSSFEAYLGTKQSHGCIRIQRRKNDEGYNHKWLWDNIKVGTKVLIWDDLNRVDTPSTWYPNPKN